jgi:hypothetical protein
VLEWTFLLNRTNSQFIAASGKAKDKQGDFLKDGAAKSTSPEKTEFLAAGRVEAAACAGCGSWRRCGCWAVCTGGSATEFRSLSGNAPVGTVGNTEGEDGITFIKREKVRFAIERGYWDLAESMTTAMLDAGMDASQVTSRQSKGITARLGRLREITARKQVMQQAISPTFEWAQRTGNIFLNVKYAHKMDTPSTLGVKVDQVLFGENTLVFKAHNSAKYFKLDLKFERNIVAGVIYATSLLSARRGLHLILWHPFAPALQRTPLMSLRLWEG